MKKTQYVIKYRLSPRKEGKPVYYNVERGDFGAREECTTFSNSRDAKMVKLGLQEEYAMSLQKLEVVSCPV